MEFHRCHFAESARFLGTRFGRGASFFDCTFCKEANFDWSVFTGKAYFWRTRFLGPASFLQFRTESSDRREENYLYPSEANYSWARFEDSVNFYRAHFSDRTYFYRTIFGGQADFSEAKFHDAVSFYGAPWEVCVTRDDLGRDLFRRLLEAGVLILDMETGPEPYPYGHFEAVTSVEVLRGRLGGVGLTLEEREAVEAVWRREAQPTFPPDHEILFRAVGLNTSAGAEMASVDMRHCLLSGTDVDRITFMDVRWPADWKPFWLGRRSIVADERATRAAHELAALSQLYSRLGKNYDRERGFQEASDFYYGEMEARRRATPLPWRILSISAAYKYLSGYGENYAIALTWLIAVVLAIFPLLYYLISPYRSVPLAILHSLRVSTFLPAEMKAAAPVPTQFVEGIERIAVALQVGLTALAIKRRFGRK